MLRGFLKSDINKIDSRILEVIDIKDGKMWCVVSIANDGRNMIAVSDDSRESIEFVPVNDWNLSRRMLTKKDESVSIVENISHHINNSRLTDESYQDVCEYISRHEMILSVNVVTGIVIDSTGKSHVLSTCTDNDYAKI